MAESDLCKCSYPKTRAVVDEYCNCCPACGKRLVVEAPVPSILEAVLTSDETYETPISTPIMTTMANMTRTPRSLPNVPFCTFSGVSGSRMPLPRLAVSKEEQRNVEFSLSGLREVEHTRAQYTSSINAFSNADNGPFGSVAPRRMNFPKLDMPRYDGNKKSNPKHYFFKVAAFFAEYGIRNPNERIRLLSHSLENEALDLFLSLGREQQGDLSMLEEIFIAHFQPQKHSILGMGEFLQTKKGNSETVSEFCLRLRTHAEQHGIPSSVVKAIFIQGLPSSFQKHIALKDVDTLEEIFRESIVFERVAKIENSSDFPSKLEGKRSDDVGGVRGTVGFSKFQHPRNDNFRQGTSFQNHRHNGPFYSNNQGNMRNDNRFRAPFVPRTQQNSYGPYRDDGNTTNNSRFDRGSFSSSNVYRPIRPFYDTGSSRFNNYGNDTMPSAKNSNFARGDYPFHDTNRNYYQRPYLGRDVHNERPFGAGNFNHNNRSGGQPFSDNRLDKLENKFDKVFNKLVELDKKPEEANNVGRRWGNDQKNQTRQYNFGTKECEYCHRRGHVQSDCFLFNRNQSKQGGDESSKGKSGQAMLCSGKKQCLQYAYTTLSDTSLPADFGLSCESWDKGRVAIINFTSPFLNLNSSILNGSLPRFASVYGGVSACGTEWKNVGKVLPERLDYGQFVETVFDGGFMIHACLPGKDVVESDDKALSMTYNMMGVLICRILKFVVRKGMSEICIPLLTLSSLNKQDSSRAFLSFLTDTVIHILNKAILRAISMFLEKYSDDYLVVVFTPADDRNDSFVGPQGNETELSLTSKLEPTSRSKQDWLDAHSESKNIIEIKRPIILLLGDSIIRNLKYSTETQKKHWRTANIINIGMKGDCVENVLFRITDLTFPSSVKQVYLAVGTNNLVKNTADEIVGTLLECVEVLKSKGVDEVFVQAILPRFSVHATVSDKISRVNSLLKITLAQNFVDPSGNLVNGEGQIKESLFAKDGLHLSNTGSAILAKFILDTVKPSSVLGAKSLFCRSEMVDEVLSFSPSDMMIQVEVNGMPITALVDTGSGVTLINEAVVHRIAGVKIGKPVLVEVRGISNTPLPVYGTVDLFLRLGTQTHNMTCHVMSNMLCDMVLGLDQMNKVISGINFRDNNLSLVTMGEDAGGLDKNNSCVLRETCTLSPHSLERVKIAFADKQIAIEDGVIRGNRKLLSKGVVIHNDPIMHGQDMSCIVHNVTDKQVILQQNSVVGSVHYKDIKYKNKIDRSDKQTIMQTESVVRKTSCEDRIGIVHTITGRAIEGEDLEDHKNVLARELVSKAEVLSLIENLDIGEDDTMEVRERLRAILVSYADVFATDASLHTSLPGVEHVIEVVDETPIRQRAYRANIKHQEIIDNTVEKLLADGIIEPSLSEWSSPVTLVQKKGGDFRMCVDYRKLNKVMKKEEWPLPRIQDILDSLGGAKYFSVLDLKSGFFQVKMAPESRKYTAFICKKGLYQYLYMPFGLRSNPNAFSRVMHMGFSDMLWKQLILYIDDIIIFSRDLVTHMANLQGFLARCLELHLKINLKKCTFLKTSVIYLGHVVSDVGILPNPAKIEVVKNHPTPRTKKQVQSFMGLINYYRRFIKNIAHLSAPLNGLLKKHARFAWTPECEASFRELIDTLVSGTLLSYPDFAKEFVLQVDACDSSLGYVLSQEKDGEDTAIAFGGTSLNKHQILYPTHQKELLAVLSGIKHFHHYLYGRHFTVYCDNTAVSWLFAQKEPKGRIARWVLSLLEYDFTVKYRPGVVNGNADAISRIPLVSTIRSDDFLYRLKIEQGKDSSLEQIRDDLEAGRVVRNYVVDTEGLLWYEVFKGSPNQNEYKLVIPQSLQNEILTLNHDSIMAGHGGVTKTYERLKELYFWPNMHSSVVKYCKECKICIFKKDAHRSKAPLCSVKVTYPFEKVFCDLIGPVAQCNGFNYVIVFVCALTKWVEARPLKTSDADEAAAALFEDIFVRHGACTQLICDRGSNFTSMLFSEVCKLLQIDKFHVTAYHPAGNGVVERVNGTIMKILTTALRDYKDDWVRFLPATLFAYRSGYHQSIKMTPFEALYGRKAVCPVKLAHYKLPTLRTDGNGALDEYLQKLKLVQDQTVNNYDNTQQKIKQVYDKRVNRSSFQPGDKVVLKRFRLRKGECKKFADKFSGPFEILSQLSDVNYVVKSLENNRIDTVHFNRMKLLTDVNHDMMFDREEVDELFGESDSDFEFEGFSSVSESDDDEVESAGESDMTNITCSVIRASCSGRRDYKGGFGIFSGVMLCLLVLCWKLVVGVGGVKSPNIGSVYNCEHTQHVGIFAPPSEKLCKRGFHVSNLTVMSAEVRQYRQEVTQLDLYYCEARYIVKECNENFLGVDDKQFHTSYIRVTKAQCYDAFSKLITPYGPLVPSGVDQWQSAREKPYKCAWLQNNKESYIVFKMSRVKGSLIGDNPYIHQSLTVTNCVVREQLCVPREQKMGVIVWRRTRHNANLYHNLGIFDVHRVGNFFLVGKMGIGGSVIRETGDLILLDNSYMLKILRHSNSTGRSNATSLFLEYSRKFAKSTKSNVQRDLMEGRLVKQLARENENIVSMAAILCENQRKIHQLQIMNMHSYPDTVGEIVYQEKGILVMPMGDALLVKKCMVVLGFKIAWDQKINDTCYLLYPVRLVSGDWKFLELSTRRIFNRSQDISCHSRPQQTYIKDKYGRFWVYTLGMGFKETKVKFDHYYEHHCHCQGSHRLILGCYITRGSNLIGPPC